MLHEDDSIGRHNVSFWRDGEDLHVDIDIDVEVRFAFLTLYHYRHQNREVWRRGRLVAMDSATDDNGEHFEVTARATDDGLRVDSSDGTIVVPPDTLPTSYWNPATVRRDRLLDSQSGQLLDVRITPVGAESVAIDGVAVPARKYVMSGDLDLELWYTAQGRWAKIAFEAHGANIQYAPANQ